MTLDSFLDEWHDGSETLLVHTSGSTGKPKAMWVEKRRMVASARITCDFLGLKEGDRALLCMSLDYIAGKMMVVRALTRGLQLVTVEPCGHPLSREVLKDDGRIDFAAMVPLQVYHSLHVAEERERLMQIRHLIIGGGAVDEEMARELKGFPNAVWSTYGMTETLSHIALRRLNGPEASEWYTPFASVSVSTNEEGCLVIDAPEVCEEHLITNDIAELKDGRFRILGRKDNVICSGGIKIQIEEVEKLLRNDGAQLVNTASFMITKCKDEKFGEAVVLLTEDQDVETWKRKSKQALPKYWQPRHYLYVEKLPYTETGKPARKKAEEMCEKILKGEGRK